jgi:hypothetical protein
VQACSLYPCDGRDLLEKLEELHEHMVGVNKEHVAKAAKLVALVKETSKALVDLRLPPIWEIH